MAPTELKQKVLEFLNRAPISGEEAEIMVLCKQWVRNVERITPLLSPVPGQQVADVSGK